MLFVSPTIPSPVNPKQIQKPGLVVVTIINKHSGAMTTSKWSSMELINRSQGQWPSWNKKLLTQKFRALIHQKQPEKTGLLPNFWGKFKSESSQATCLIWTTTWLEQVFLKTIHSYLNKLSKQTWTRKFTKWKNTTKKLTIEKTFFKRQIKPSLTS